MHNENLRAVAASMVAPGKGVLAIDESSGTMNKRLAALGVDPTDENRRAYRDLLLTTPGIGEYISGAILFDETIRQQSLAGEPFVDLMKRNGILSGIKVDTGAKPLSGASGETVTEGLDGLRERIADYVRLGATFAKWRAVVDIDDARPSHWALNANAHALARYASLCQEGGLVPIVEPEVLMDGAHTLERCAEVTMHVLHAVFAALADADVDLAAIVLKPSMVIAGKKSPVQASVARVAAATLDVLGQTVPAACAGIAFLSGGQGNELATQHLDAMNRQDARLKKWPLTFSYGRALQQPTLEAWARERHDIVGAQGLLANRARCNSRAAIGAYQVADEEMVAQLERKFVTA